MPAGDHRGDDVFPDGTRQVLEEELGRALHARATAPVDVGALIEGSQRRARQLRTRRVALGTAGVVLVLALPVGIDLLGGRPEPGPAATLASPPPAPGWTVSGMPDPGPSTGIGSAVTGTADVPRTPGTSAPAPSGVLPPPVAYAIPDSFGLDPADVPGLTLLDDGGQVAGLPAVHGQVCRAARTGDVASIAGRQWSWTSARPATGAGMTVTLTITGWSDGDGATAFDHLVANTGRCVFTTDQKNDSGKLNATVEGWMGTSAVGGLSYGRAVVRVGDILGGIEVTDARGHNAVIDDVQDLVQSVVEQLTSEPTPTPTAA